ncbi:MAG: tail fiber domain-containing protein [Bacteroidetes bacterium]|nr:tail fiber domain-containing protein [Bacteroidota bacterium]
MKNTIRLAMNIAVAIFCLSSKFTFAQWNLALFPDYRTVNITSVGIGQFTVANRPLAALHVNTNLTPIDPNFTRGEVFRTDCPASTAVNFITAWRMFNGGNARGMIFNWGFNPVVVDRNNFSIQATGGDMTFHTGTLNAQGIALERMRILASNGNVGIGTANPLVQLDVNGSVNVKNVALPAVSGYHIDTAIVLANYGIPTNIFVGPGAGANNVPPSTGTYNTFCGYNAGVNNKFGNDNVILGSGSAGYNSGVFAADDRNIYIGFNAAYTTRGNDNVIIGANANSTYIINNAAAIGSNAYVTQDNSLVLGSINGINGAIADTKVGIGITAPTAPLEINAVSVNASGLKFTQLTSAFTPVTTATKYLSVDGTGNVILVNDGGGVGGSGDVVACTSLSAADLNFVTKWTNTSPKEICKSQIFDNGTNVGIGTTTPLSKFQVTSNGNYFMGGQLTGGTAHNATFGLDYAGSVAFVKNGSPANTSDWLVTIGHEINGTGSIKIWDNGVYPILLSTAYSSAVNVGNTLGFGIGTGPAADTRTHIRGTGNPASNTYALKVDNAWQNPLFYVRDDGKVGIGVDPVSSSYILTISGTAFSTATGVLMSDAAIKINIDSIANALAIITQLKPHSYNFNTVNYPYMNLPLGKQYGLIGQEVESVLSDIVSNNIYPAVKDSLGNIVVPPTNYKGLNYTALIPILIQGMKEQQQTIQSLQSAVGSLKSIVSECCSTNVKTTNQPFNQSTITLSLPDAPVLGDARPNPNSGYAEIPYYLPEFLPSPAGEGSGMRSGGASIIFTDMLGRTMQEKILTAGYGIIGIDTNDLPSGTYTYTMLLNGKTLDTKTMIKTK